MKDEDKTKEQLIKELVELRQRIAELEASETERRRAEEALRESKERLSTVVTNVPLVLFAIDRDGIFTLSEGKGLEILGLKPGRAVGMSVYDLYRDVPEILNNVRCALAGGMVTSVVNVGGIWYETWYNPVKDQSNEVVGLIGVAADITERKRAEEALRESEEKFRRVVEQSGDGIVLTDEQGTIIEWNRGEERITGLTRAEVLGRSLWGVMFHVTPEEQRTPAMCEQLKALLLDFFRTRQAPWLNQLRESTIQRPDGMRRTVQQLVFPIKTDKDFMVGSISRDVTERKQAEEALRKSEERYRRVVQNVQDVIYATDAQGMLTFVSGACEELVNVPCDRLLGKNLLEAGALVDVSSDVMQRQFIDPFAETVKKGLDTMVYEYPLRVRGEIRWFEFKGKIEYGEEGNFVGGSGVMRDITERKRAEEQLQASLREKEVLLKEIHHRVKNNLQVISSLLRWQSEYIEDERSLEMFKESQDRVKSMALAHEQLYQSKNLARIDFAEYVRNLATHLFRSYRVGSSTITLKVDVDDVFLGVDTAIPCGLIINELVSNALKHAFPAGREGEICINLHADDDELTLTVSNNGVSFPGDLDFRHTESLGLHLVNTLIGQLEGTIELDRSGGTAFKITFARPTY